MGFFKKEEPRSWNGETASEQAERGSGDSGGHISPPPPKCPANRHLRPMVRFGFSENVKPKPMTCLHCGENWEE